MKTYAIHIPFAQIAPCLPMDGQRIVVWQGARRWPGNSTSFERYETLEIAFGRAIRAQAKHRRSEKSRKPGFSARLGYLHVRGGWAAHKQVPVHNDYFDGTFDAAVQVAVSAGKIRCKVLSLDLTWNASLAARLLDVTGLVRSFILDIIEREVVAVLDRKIEAAIADATRELQQRLPGATAVSRGVDLLVLPGKLMIVVKYEEKPPMKRLVDVARKAPALAGKRKTATGVATRKHAAAASRVLKATAGTTRKAGKRMA